jgi:hypothetical protein
VCIRVVEAACPRARACVYTYIYVTSTTLLISQAAHTRSSIYDILALSPAHLYATCVRIEARPAGCVRAPNTRTCGRASEHTARPAADDTRRTRRARRGKTWPAVRSGRAVPAALREGSETERARRKAGRDGGMQGVLGVAGALPRWQRMAG